MPDHTPEYHVFISYAHIDNQTLTREQEGWITFLHRALEIRLAQLSGERPRIWRDPKLHGNDQFDNVITSKIQKAETFVAVLSPGYVESDWCRREIAEFIEARLKKGGVLMGNSSRIFKVIKTRLSLERQPREIQNQLGYEFFAIDPESKRLKEFNRGFGTFIEPEYMDRLEDLASDIDDMLESIGRPLESPAEGCVPPRGSVVFLAETTYDLRTRRDQVRRELESQGHTVLPDRDLSLLEWELSDMVREDLERSILSIHLIGEQYGAVPEGADRSTVELQLDLAGELSGKKVDFSCIIWMPEKIMAKDPRQGAFIKRLMKETILQPKDDLLSAGIEELKAVILDKLEEKAKKKEGRPMDAEKINRIYLIYDQRDIHDIEPLDDFFYDRDHDVLHPLFDGDESDIIEEHRENLRICDGVLIYHGNAGEAWLRSKLRDLRKVAGYGRTNPVKSSAIYVGPPRDHRRERFKTREVDELIKNFQFFSPDCLSGFLARLEGGDGGETE
ncbi:MAG: toll/interleukin-1 receptor domain-containing protein [Desulfobacteraceae bacterium]|nr:toll/interleukin-1 receptor domain-containing protein [Desulfobacteraceae bacterium]